MHETYRIRSAVLEYIILLIRFPACALHSENVMMIQFDRDFGLAGPIAFQESAHSGSEFVWGLNSFVEINDAEYALAHISFTAEKFLDRIYRMHRI